MPLIDTDDVEPCPVARKPAACREEHLRGPDELALLAPVDGLRCTREPARRAVANLDKHQAIVIAHDEVDFTVPAAEVAGNRRKAPVPQVSKRELLGAIA